MTSACRGEIRHASGVQVSQLQGYYAIELKEAVQSCPVPSHPHLSIHLFILLSLAQRRPIYLTV